MLSLRTQDELVSILAAGAELEISAKKLHRESILPLATAAKKSKTRLTLRDTREHSAGDLAEIAKAGRGFIRFIE
jgi:hypothetical protein